MILINANVPSSALMSPMSRLIDVYSVGSPPCSPRPPPRARGGTVQLGAGCGGAGTDRAEPSRGRLCEWETLCGLPRLFGPVRTFPAAVHAHTWSSSRRFDVRRRRRRRKEPRPRAHCGFKSLIGLSLRVHVQVGPDGSGVPLRGERVEAVQVRVAEVEERGGGGGGGGGGAGWMFAGKRRPAASPLICGSAPRGDGFLRPVSRTVCGVKQRGRVGVDTLR